MKAFQTRRREDGSTASSSAHALAAQNDVHRRQTTALGGRSDDDDGGGGISGGESSSVATPHASSTRQQQQGRPTTKTRTGRRNGGDGNASIRPVGSSSSGGTTTRTPPSYRRLGADDEPGPDDAYASSTDDDDDDGASIASGSTSSGHGGGGSSSRRHEAELGTWHYLPLLFVVLPVIAGAVVGRGDAWRDLLVLGLVGYWVYWLIKTPWELYHASLHHSLLDADGASSPLAKDHVFYLALTVASPVLGAFLLTLTRSTLTYIPSYLSPSSIRLFLLAALIKPVSNVVSLLRDRTAHLKAAVSAPKHDEAELLRRKLRGLEREVKTLRHEAASRTEVSTLREDVYAAPGGLVDLGRHVKRVERRAELGRLTLGERLELVQRGLLGLREEVEDERERQGYAFGQWVLQLLRLSSGSDRGQLAGTGTGGKASYIYSPAVAAAGLITPHTRQVAGEDGPAPAVASRVSPLPPSWSPPPPQPEKASSGPLAVAGLLVRSMLAVASAAVSVGVKSFFWPVLLTRWALGQFIEVVQAG